jgi:hypothetical protein
MTEPNLDEQIDQILTSVKAWNYGGEGAARQRKALGEILALISDQVARARIEELEHIVSGNEYSADDFDWYEITRAEYTGTKYYSEVRHLTKEERIAELEATLNGVKNK